MSDWGNIFIWACLLAAALICGPATGIAGEAHPSVEELAVHADKLYAKGDYDTALTVFKQLAEAFKGDPARLAGIQKKLLVCENAVHPPRTIAVSRPAPARAPVPAAEVMSAAGRRPHPAPKPGELLEITLKSLGNFEYDQDKGGEIPADVKRLNGARIRVHGYMIPLDGMEDITHFALVTSLTSGSIMDVMLVQHQILADCPRGKAVTYFPDEIVVEGTLTVAEKREDDFIVSIFTLDVTSVKAAPK